MTCISCLILVIESRDEAYQVSSSSPDKKSDQVINNKRPDIKFSLLRSLELGWLVLLIPPRAYFSTPLHLVICDEDEAQQTTFASIRLLITSCGALWLSRKI